MDPQKTNEAKPKSVGIIIPPSEIRSILFNIFYLNIHYFRNR